MCRSSSTAHYSLQNQRHARVVTTGGWNSNDIVWRFNNSPPGMGQRGWTSHEQLVLPSWSQVVLLTGDFYHSHTYCNTSRKFPELLEWAGDSFLTKVAETLIGKNSLLDLLLPYQKKHASTEQPLVQILQGNLKISKNAKKVRAVRTLDNLEQTSVCLKNHWMKSSGKWTLGEKVRRRSKSCLRHLKQTILLHKIIWNFNRRFA